MVEQEMAQVANFRAVAHTKIQHLPGCGEMLKPCILHLSHLTGNHIMALLPAVVERKTVYTYDD
jgi:hypothetical protein